MHMKKMKADLILKGKIPPSEHDGRDLSGTLDFNKDNIETALNSRKGYFVKDEQLKLKCRSQLADHIKYLTDLFQELGGVINGV